jgi:prevent-host-death family protein
MCSNGTMSSIGIRELRQRASEFIRRVEAGETIEVTDRGRPVALLSPIPDAPPLEQLRAAGEVHEASGGIDDLPEPLELGQGQESPSALLSRLRVDGR